MPETPEAPGRVAFRRHDLTDSRGPAVEPAESGGVDRIGSRALEQQAPAAGAQEAELAKQAAVDLYQSSSRVSAIRFLGRDPSANEKVSRSADGIEYEELEAKADAELRTDAGAAAEVILDRTPFYAEGGGQIGDRGELRTADGTVLFEVDDTQKPVGGVIVHRGTLRGRLRVGEAVAAVVTARRDQRCAITPHAFPPRALRNTSRSPRQQYPRRAGLFRFDYPRLRGLTTSEAAIETVPPYHPRGPAGDPA